jgi:hypothetical protein
MVVKALLLLQKPMNERIAKLEAEVEALFDLTIRAHVRFIFLRPMLADQQLRDRIGKEAKAIGFQQLRDWLYWDLVQELSKICSDKEAKSPSIAAKIEVSEDIQMGFATTRALSIYSGQI